MIKVLEDRISKTWGSQMFFSSQNVKIMQIKLVNRIHQIKNFCSWKDNVKKTNRQATDWKKILTAHLSVKSLHPTCV